MPANALAVAGDRSRLRVKERGGSGHLPGDVSLDEVVAILGARLPDETG